MKFDFHSLSVKCSTSAFTLGAESLENVRTSAYEGTCMTVDGPIGDEVDNRTTTIIVTFFTSRPSVEM